jgi:hypothetical protein
MYARAAVHVNGSFKTFKPLCTRPVSKKLAAVSNSMLRRDAEKSDVLKLKSKHAKVEVGFTSFCLCSLVLLPALRVSLRTNYINWPILKACEAARALLIVAK